MNKVIYEFAEATNPYGRVGIRGFAMYKGKCIASTLIMTSQEKCMSRLNDSIEWLKEIEKLPSDVEITW